MEFFQDFSLSVVRAELTPARVFPRNFLHVPINAA
jgi:hypothetical protein